MRQIEQNYRTGAMRLVEVPVPMTAPGRNLVASRVSLISAGTEKQIIDVARLSLAGKAKARPDLVRKTIAKARQEGLLSTARKVFAKLDTPIPLGYSLAGTIVESSVTAGNYMPGMRVACAGAGAANHADYNAVPKNLTVPIPDGVSDEDAAFVTLGAIALQGVRVAQPTLGERVVVMGLGLIGQLTVQLLKANGCHVIGYDPNPERAALARTLGADIATHGDLATAVLSATEGVGADAVIVTASSKASGPINLAAEISRMKGRVVIVGMVGMDLDREPFYKRELDIRLSMSYGPGRYDAAYEEQGHDYPLAFVRWTERRNMQAFLELIAAGKVTPSALVSHRFHIDAAAEAYALFDSDEPYLAILLTYPDEPIAIERRVAIAGGSVMGSGIGFVGMGNYSKSVLLPAVKAAGKHSLRTVVTATGLSARNAAEKYGFATASTDVEAMLADPTIATVFVATRHNTHADLVIRTLQAGRNVFVEKPLALDRASLDAVMAAAAATRAILTVGFNRRFAPMVEQARAAAIGSAGPVMMQYRVNAGYVPADSWLHGPEGGGRIVGEVCHFVDTLSALCGADPVDAISIGIPGVDDSAQAVIRFSDGSTGTIMYSPLGSSLVPKERIEVFGRDLVVQIDDFRSISIAQGGKTTTTRTRSQDKGQAALVSAFLAACDGRGDVPIAYATLESVSAATLAIAGRAV